MKTNEELQEIYRDEIVKYINFHFNNIDECEKCGIDHYEKMERDDKHLQERALFYNHSYGSLYVFFNILTGMPWGHRKMIIDALDTAFGTHHRTNGSKSKSTLAKPTMEKDVSIVNVIETIRSITFCSTPEALHDFDFGTLMPYRGDTDDVYMLWVDPRYVFGEVVNYIENYEPNENL